MQKNVINGKTPQEWFAERLKESMRIKGVSSVTIERETGISHSAISAWTNLKRSPQIDMLCVLADYFDCTVDYLLGRTDY